MVAAAGLAAAPAGVGSALMLGTPAPARAVVSATAAALRLPPPAAEADYQLGGAYPPPRGVRIVTRDRLARPAAGAYGICYVNAFQSQPGDGSWWRRWHPDLLLRAHDGHVVTDPGYPREYLLDISTPTRRARLAVIVGGWIDGCARSGFSAVEPDNLDSWTRSRGLLKAGDAVAFARLLTARAHARALAIGQKNTAELAPQGRRLGFDFAVAEECQVFDECRAFSAAYGRRVIEIEYTDNGRKAFAESCAQHQAERSIVLRDRALTRPGTPGYTYASC